MSIEKYVTEYTIIKKSVFNSLQIHTLNKAIHFPE